MEAAAGDGRRRVRGWRKWGREKVDGFFRLWIWGTAEVWLRFGPAGWFAAVRCGAAQPKGRAAGLDTRDGCRGASRGCPWAVLSTV